MLRPTALAGLALLVVAPLGAQNPAELGAVHWQRDHDAGFAEAARTQRPVFLLFQEIPGCETCVDFGQGPLSHPLLVEALESEFVPVAVYNNIDGRDAELLKRYEEPSWNNPVFRLFSADGKELLARKDRVWSLHGVATRLADGLQAIGRELPGYLQLVVEESDPRPLARATFAMHCYWEGEALLGGLPGVVGTEAGWIGEEEVVEVRFRPAALDYRVLLEKAISMECASRVFAEDAGQLGTAQRLAGEQAVLRDAAPRRAKDSDQGYYLLQSPLRFLPLTPLQSVKLNAALGAGTDPLRWLSPRQRALAARLEAALRADPQLCAGLERPASVAALAAYETKLRKRLLEAAPPAGQTGR